ncbi:DnaT-like ssDNA-binding protein [Pseudorhizobium marinum]|uniref:DnaT-like ssDNA-binding protein n=1 Tax=Pseudorhizobium marinum TaxID=1496690 RepID=UPI00068BF680|nr:DnaT-like ssDNA-binding protein [Pseudorhizobium marinum]
MPDHYGTLPAALIYHEARGNAAWTAAGVDDAKRAAALVRASQALDALYGARYPGVIASADQDLLWPRTDVIWRGEDLAADVVPAPIEKAAYELSLRELVKPGSLAPDVKAGPQKVLTEVKGVKWSVVGDTSSRAALPIVDGILAEILTHARTGTTVTTLARF